MKPLSDLDERELWTAIHPPLPCVKEAWEFRERVVKELLRHERQR